MGHTVANRLAAALEALELRRLELGAAAETAATTADRQQAAESTTVQEQLRTARARARGQLSAAQDGTQNAVGELFRGGSPYAWSPWDSGVWTSEYREPLSPPQLVAAASLHMAKPEGFATFPLALPAIGASVVITHDAGASAAAHAFAQSFVVRALAASQPGAMRVHLVDAAGFGQNLGVLSRLPEPLASGPVRAVAEEITNELRTVLDHIQELNTKVLLGGTDTLVDRWRRGTANGIPCSIVVAGGLPIGLKADNFERLCSVARAGHRCGIAVVAVFDTSRPLTHGIKLSDLTEHGHHFHVSGDGYASWESAPPELHKYVKASCPDPPGHAQYRFINDVLAPAARQGANRPVRLRYFLQQEKPWMVGTETKLSAVIGRRGDGSAQELSLGDAEGVPIHGLLVGPTGSGKTTLLHSLVHSLAHRHSPEELELHLLDMKAGVEFAEYAPRPDRPTLPHIRTVGIEADPHFALGVLRHLVTLDEQRRELFKQAADRYREPVPNLPTYRRVTGKTLPRILLVADEFQLMMEGETEAQAWEALEILAKQARSQGIHLLLATQSLASLGTLRGSQVTSIFNQLHLRVALRCPPDELGRVLGRVVNARLDNNRRGSGVLNEARGDKDHDVLFQTAILEPDERSNLRQHLAGRINRTSPIRVSRGTGGVELVDVADTIRHAEQPTLYVGAPVGVQPTVLGVPLAAGDGRGLLLSARDERLAIAQICSSLLAFSLQEQVGDIQLTVVDLLPENLPARSPLDDVIAYFDGRVQHVGQDRMSLLPTLLEAPTNTNVVAVVGLHHAGITAPIRPDSSHPGSALTWLFTTAPAKGVHPIIWIDEPDRLKSLGKDSTRLQLRCSTGIDQFTAASFLGRKPAFDAPRGRLWFRDLRDDGEAILVDPFARPSPEIVAPSAPPSRGGART